jgi:hypothetical protein
VHHPDADSENKLRPQMIWRHRGIDIPVEQYHGVPKGWYAEEIFARHEAMRGKYPISDIEIRKWGAPSWMPERYEWLRYRETLYRVADGIRAGDHACVEIAVQYIELRYIGSYSGFLRAKLARRLKNAPLTDGQKVRLNVHFLNLVLTRDYTEEFREYRQLWCLIIAEKELKHVLSHFGELSRRPHALNWLAQITSAFEKRAANQK